MPFDLRLPNEIPAEFAPGAEAATLPVAPLPEPGIRDDKLPIATTEAPGLRGFRFVFPPAKANVLDEFGGVVRKFSTGVVEQIE